MPVSAIEDIDKKLKKIEALNDPNICVFSIKFENNFELKCNILDENGNIIYNHKHAFEHIKENPFFQILDSQGKIKFIDTYNGLLYVKYNYAELNKV